MIDFVHPIPDLTGQICESFIRQDFSYNGQEAIVSILFLKIRNGTWHRFFFDCTSLFWKQVDAPDVCDTRPADEFHSFQTEIGQQHGLNGSAIREIKALVVGERPELHISFSNGIKVRLRDFCDYQLLEIAHPDENKNYA